MSKKPGSSAYKDAGVDIDAQDLALSRVKTLARGTFTEGVLTDIGSFGGLFRPNLSGLEEPVLVASADGVGTKLRVARMVGDYSTVGRDLVNHCVNDILVQGARPLFFLDYVGAGILEPDSMVDLVTGVADGCRENRCALLGGETAEMPGFYDPGDYELVGFVVGMADRGALLPGERVAAGDVLIGLPSAGLHTNGYSLARKILFETLALGPDDSIPGAKDRRSAARVLLDPHLSYLSALEPLLNKDYLHGMAHITGGGLTDNLPRILPEGLQAAVRLGGWEMPEIFHILQTHGGVDPDEMLRVFNMGVGMVAVVAAEGLDEALRDLIERGHEPFVVGRVEGGDGGVVYQSDSSGSAASNA